MMPDHVSRPYCAPCQNGENTHSKHHAKENGKGARGKRYDTGRYPLSTRLLKCGDVLGAVIPEEAGIRASSRRRPGSSLPFLDPGLRRGDGGQGRPPHEVVWASAQSSVARASVPGNFSFQISSRGKRQNGGPYLHRSVLSHSRKRGSNVWDSSHVLV
jgi:hypothetical protein